MYIYSVYIWRVNKEKTIEMVDKKDIKDLFKNFCIALDIYSVKDLNNSLQKIIHKEDDLKKEIDATIKIVADLYKIPVSVIMYSKKRGLVHEARIIIYAILHLDFNLSLRHISKKVFSRKHHNSVTEGINMFTDMVNNNFPRAKEIKNNYSECRKKALEITINSPK